MEDGNLRVCLLGVKKENLFRLKTPQHKKKENIPIGLQIVTRVATNTDKSK